MTGEVVRHGEDDRRFNALWRDAQALAKSKLVPRALQDKPHDVLLVLATGDDLVVPRSQALAQLYPIEGRVVPSAQMQSGLARRAGHEVRIEETSSERCTVAIRRRDADYWQKVTWTLDDARRAGLLDTWVERWVSTSGGSKRPERYVVGDDRGIDAVKAERAPEWARALIDTDKLHRRDNWWKYPDDMLCARAITRAVKRFCPDALMNLGAGDVDLEHFVDEHPATVEPAADERHGVDDEDDDAIEDADLVDDEELGDRPGPVEQVGDDGDSPVDAPETPSEPAALSRAPFAQAFARGVRERIRGGDAERAALVTFATDGRTTSARAVEPDEVSDCWRALADVERGRVELVTVDGQVIAREADL